MHKNDGHYYRRIPLDGATYVITRTHVVGWPPRRAHGRAGPARSWTKPRSAAAGSTGGAMQGRRAGVLEVGEDADDAAPHPAEQASTLAAPARLRPSTRPTPDRRRHEAAYPGRRPPWRRQQTGHRSPRRDDAAGEGGDVALQRLDPSAPARVAERGLVTGGERRAASMACVVSIA